MVTSCCAFGCKEKHVKGGKVTFHSFPQDEMRRKEWLILVRRANFKITGSTRICSKHFEDKCFDREKFGGTWLKKDAKPTIFDFPSHVKCKETYPKALKTDRKDQPSPSTANDSTPETQKSISFLNDFDEVGMKEMHTISKEYSNSPQGKMEVSDSALEKPPKRLHYLGDFTDDDMDSPSYARKALFLAKEQNLRFKMKLKAAQRQKNDLANRFAKLKKKMSDIKKKFPIPDSACDIFEDGKSKTWDLMRIHDSVAVIIYNSTRQLLLFVKQFRPAVYYSEVKLEDCEDGNVDVAKYPSKLGMTIELCAGIVDKDQSLAETARDEVLEECGYDVPLSDVQKVTSYRAGVGITGSIQTLFYVEVTDSMKVSEGGGNAYEGELIDVIGMNLSQARSLIYDEKVARPTSLLFALMWFFDHKAPSKLNQKL